MSTTQFLHTPELTRFELPPRVLESLEYQYDILQREARINGFDYNGDTLGGEKKSGEELKRELLQLAGEQGFHFLDSSTVGVLYYEPSSIRKPHIDPRGNTLIVTTGGQGTYRQYPHTDEYKDKVCFEQPISPDEAEYAIGVTTGSALLTNQSIPHSFHNGVFPRTAFYIV